MNLLACGCMATSGSSKANWLMSKRLLENLITCPANSMQSNAKPKSLFSAAVF